MVDKELRDVVQASKAEHTELFVHEQDLKLTRFAHGGIHQNISQKVQRGVLAVYHQQKRGQVSITDLSPRGLQEGLDKALEAAQYSAPDPQFQGLPEAQDEYAPSLPSAAESTAQSTPQERARIVAEIAAAGKGDGLQAFGTFSTQKDNFQVLNSQGREREWDATKAYLKVLYMGGGGEGYGEDVHVDVQALNHVGVIDRARQKCLASRETEGLEPGEYTVILEPGATGGLLQYLNMAGFNGLACAEGRSYFSQKQGEKVLDTPLTIIDDPHDPQGMPLPYDFEGTVKKPLTIIDRGIFKTPLYDTYIANTAGVQSTGHALPPSFRHMGAMAMNLTLKPGEKSTENMMEDVEKGVLVTRFHYVGLIHPTRTIITGLTRDGTFLIENGKITRALKNLRFTQSIMEALQQVDAVGSQLERVPSFFGAMLAPSLRIKKFRFTGIAEM